MRKLTLRNSPPRPEGLREVWRCSRFLAQIYEDSGFTRISVIRADSRSVANYDTTGRFSDGISWDELQWIKAQVGYGDRYAVELFPPDDEVTNVANMRHLWVLDEAPPFGWRSE